MTAIYSRAISQTFQSSSKEIGYQIGTSFYLGDLNPTSPFSGRRHVTQGGYYRHHFNSRVGVRLQLLQGVVEAWDEDSQNAWAQNRNLHFRNKIVEFSISGEINYIDHVMGDPGDRLTGYLTAGLAYYISLKKAPMLSANLKSVYDEEFERAADNDRERVSFKTKPAQAYIP